MDSLGIEGAWVHTPRIYGDDRGSFLESFRNADVLAAAGYRMDVAQVNCSVSRRGALRGIHFAEVPPGQAKYITCVRGAILDVVVDLRTGSPRFGSWETIRLDDKERRSVFISEGLGHGFLALTDECTVLYQCSTPYAPDREHGVHPLDPAIGIAWPADVAPVLSAKDAAAPSLLEAETSGLLPSYAECLAYTTSLRAAETAQALRLEPAVLDAGDEPPPLVHRDGQLAGLAAGGVADQDRAVLVLADLDALTPVGSAVARLTPLQVVHRAHPPI